MVDTVVRMKIAALRNTPGALWGWKAIILLCGAIATLAIGLGADASDGDAYGLLALVFAGWTLGWLVAPIQSGGGGDETLLPEHFALLPIPPRRLALALFTATFVGVGPAATLAAFAVLLIAAVQVGAAATLIALLALPLQLGVVILLSRVAIGAASSAMSSRLGMEFVALQYAVMVALSATGWVLPAALAGSDSVSGDLPDSADRAVRLLPSGWAPVAVDAARRGDWFLALAALFGLAALASGLLLLWASMLQRRMTTRATGSSARSGVARTTGGRSFLPRTPLGAAIGRELRAWVREPRNAIELRVAILSGLLIVVFPLLIDIPVLLPWGGAVIAVMAGVCACNAYGLEGSSLWLTLMTPGAERIDVRAKQIAFALVFAPAALLATVILTPFGGNSALWPWILSILPALLGGATGIAILVAVMAAAPVPEAARRSGNLLAGADNVGQAFATFFLIPLVAIPPVLVLLLGQSQDNMALSWLGLPVGIATSVLVAYALGTIAVRKLETSGPELLDLLHHGPSARLARPAHANARSAWSTPPGLRGKLAMVCWTACWIPLFPQGLVPMALTLTGNEVKSWFLAFYVPDILRWPVILSMTALGLGLLATAVNLTRPRPAPKGLVR